MKQILVTFKDIKHPGYENKIAKDYAKIMKYNKTMVNQYLQRRDQFLSQILEATGFITVNPNLCQRDKLLLSYNLSICMIDKSSITVPLCLFDTKKFVISQNPSQSLIEGRE